ncbi:hypothetical protein [Estrella lausannensis]|uniref:Conserved putative membrane protein n=1 Tax=Estrella lausannensis TaxID=483423 RepID=A0A0H5E3Z7_9BACT|nr:hypothetical protein [Estrella lausannensis]CRX37940.1 Conserved putative membrane protein [Estrella lausannensis]
MFSLKNWYIFLAGAAFFHTVSHALLPYYFDLPLHLKNFSLTYEMNQYILAGSGALTILLLFLAAKTKR